MHNPDEQKKKKKKNSKQNVHQTVRLVPDITNMNFFKSMSFKSGEKQEIYTNNGKKQADGWLRPNPRHAAGIEKLG